MVVQMVAHKEGYQSRSQVVLLYQEAQMGVMTVVLKRALHLEVQEVVAEECLQSQAAILVVNYHRREISRMKVNLQLVEFAGLLVPVVQV